MPNAFEKAFNIPLPQCCSQGSCCKGASPSTPYHQLWQRAAGGDEFARGFFSIMVPYPTHEEAEAVVPGLVERTLKAAAKSKDFANAQDVVFYHCRYLTPDNRCGVWEDRPQFCRDYPDTPFVVMAPGCAFEPWGKACKEKYAGLKEEVSQLQDLKAELARLKELRGQSALQEALDENEGGHPYTKIDALFFQDNNTDNLSLVLSLTSLHVASPMRSFSFTF